MPAARQLPWSGRPKTGGKAAAEAAAEEHEVLATKLVNCCLLANPRPQSRAVLGVTVHQAFGHFLPGLAIGVYRTGWQRVVEARGFPPALRERVVSPRDGSGCRPPANSLSPADTNIP